MNNNIYTLCLGMLTTPPYDRMFEQSRRVFSPKGVAPTVHTFGGGGESVLNMIKINYHIPLVGGYYRK